MNKILLGAAAISLGLCFWACGDDDPTLTILRPKNGDTVSVPVTIKLKATHFNSGHIHVWLDIPESSRVDGNTETYLVAPMDSVILPYPGGKPVGSGWHTVAVEGATSQHADIEGMEDTVRFFVR